MRTAPLIRTVPNYAEKRIKLLLEMRTPPLIGVLEAGSVVMQFNELRIDGALS